MTAHEVNRMDGTSERRVWFQYWDTRLTYERSYHARLNYVHHNPVRHGLVREAEQYPWCSAAWFQENAGAAFCRVVKSFKTDRLQVPDEFEVRVDEWPVQ